MPNIETDLLKFSRAVTEHQRKENLSFPEAVRAILHEWLEWDACGWHGATRVARCGGGGPPEPAGFDSFELDRATSPSWAVEMFDALGDEVKIEITNMAEEAEMKKGES